MVSPLPLGPIYVKAKQIQTSEGNVEIGIDDNVACERTLLYSLIFNGDFNFLVSFWKKDGRDWVVFYPDLIVSPQLGCLWTVSMNLVTRNTPFPESHDFPTNKLPQQQENVMGSFTDKALLLNFLLRRRNSRSLILQFIKSSLEKRTNPSVMSKLFDQLNIVCSSVALEM